MAGIDKIYGTTKEYDQFLTWVNLHAKRKDLQRWFYPRNGWEDMDDRPMTNLPCYIDKWVLKNCTIDWVIECLKEQYSLNRK